MVWVSEGGKNLHGEAVVEMDQGLTLTWEGESPNVGYLNMDILNEGGGGLLQIYGLFALATTICQGSGTPEFCGLLDLGCF